MNSLYSIFQNPMAEYRGKPFWSWNGKLEKEELLRQVHVMKEMGFGGFFMHSRTGLETEYLGEEWFELINACADEAEKLGMEAWLYDEDRWPSGIAGGMVTENPEFRMKSIRLEFLERFEDISWNDNIIAAFSCKLKGVAVYDYEKIDQATPKTKLNGKQILIFTIIEMSKHSFYNGYTYIDTLNKKATEKFIELTHEKYKEKCGDRLGKSIKGVFTDEPHRGTLMDEFGAGNDNDIWRTPWTGMLCEEFANKYGYDLVERLPELFLKFEGEDVSQVKWHYVELLQQMFLDNFMKPVNEWCEKNNIILTGHVLHEDSLTAQTAMNGSVMRSYEYMGYPGIDLLGEFNNVYWIAKQLSSAARQLGKKWLLSEMYGCTGWQMDFESHKAVGDWQALFGINLRCQHLSWYTMEGEAKRDFPGSILHQSTWWKEYKYVEDYFSRIGILLSQGKPCCDVLVVNPIESVWSQVHPGYAKMLSALAPKIQTLEEKYRHLFYWLSGAHIDFDYGDEDMISRYYSIDVDQAGNPILRIGEASYKVVVLGHMNTMRSSTLKILLEFIQKGGKVIIAGDVPGYVDAVKSDSPQELSATATKVSFNKESLISSLLKNVSHTIEVADNDGNNIEDIYCQMRDDGKRKYIMLLNINREKAYENVRIKIKASGNVVEWICTTGERLAVTNVGTNGNVEICTSFEACKEHLYEITNEYSVSEECVGTEETDEKSPFGDIVKVDIGLSPKTNCENEIITLMGPYEYELDEPNVCVLDMARFRFDDAEWQPEQEILKVDQAVRTNYGLALRGGEMLQPWFAKKHEFEVKGKVSLEFVFYIDVIPSSIELVMERPEYFEVALNGQDIETTVDGWWVDKCFNKIKLPANCIVLGRNIIKLKVNFHEGINLEAIYLLGQFGVKLEGNAKALIKRQDKLFASDLTTQGLPYYTGKVSYKMNMPKELKAGDTAFIAFEEYEAACIKVTTSEGEKNIIIGWQPYEAEITDWVEKSEEIIVEVVLTRRNTFGPLHQLPLRAPAYGPPSFISEGDAFTKNYMLIPSGLLKEPVINIFRCKTV